MDDHCVRGRDIDPAFDDVGGEQHIVLPVIKGGHAVFEIGGGHLPVGCDHLDLWHMFFEHIFEVFHILDARADVEALKLSKGNATRARQQIIAWAMEDQKLLTALTRAHLSGIVAYNIERVASGRAAAARVKAASKQPANQAETQKKQEGDFGMEILKAVASSSSEVFGLENSGFSERRGQASQGHINAIKAIASKKKKS